MAEIFESIQDAIGVFGYAAFAFVLPTLVAQHWLRKQYRDCIVSSGAYWHRHYYKWIVGHRIFYTDEFVSDIWLSVFFGALCGFVGAATFLHYIEVDAPLTFLVASVCAASAFLFLIIQMERVRLIDAEVEVKRLIDPSFDNEIELRRILDGDRRYLRRVLRRNDTRA